jgi:hypothetical protein
MNPMAASCQYPSQISSNLTERAIALMGHP